MRIGYLDCAAGIVCTAVGCEALEVERWIAFPLNMGAERCAVSMVFCPYRRQPPRSCWGKRRFTRRASRGKA